MDPITQKIKHWIEEGKDPRIAHWQGGLEAILSIFLPYLAPGRLMPVQPIEKEELFVFTKALEVVDLSPNLHAAFLPVSIATKVTPPESVEKVQRIEEGKASCKLLIARPGKEMRIMCVEISPHARKPGVDIFESGVLLGTYDFYNSQDCFVAINKIVRTHIWEKGAWNRDDFKRYTVNWFEKVLDLPGSLICMEKDFSFLHSPTLIRSNPIDAVFTLIFEIFMKRANDPGGPLGESVSAIRAIPDAGARGEQFHHLAEKSVFTFLNAIKGCDAVKFDTFSDKENDRFDREYAGTIRRIVSGMVSGGSEAAT